MASSDTIPVSENRHTKRLAAPVGTTALIHNSAGYLDTLYVQDLSVEGILANGYLTEERYPINSLIKGILLNFPPCKLSSNRRISLLINEGKVVHTLIDQISKTVCYGIEFTIVSSYVNETLEKLVNKT